MEDKYLDNVFREKLELPQQHDFDESAWLDLEGRLENKPARRIALWRWVAAAGILLPMLLSTIYFYNQLKHTERQLSILETKMNCLLKKDISEEVAKSNTSKEVETPLHSKKLERQSLTLSTVANHNNHKPFTPFSNTDEQFINNNTVQKEVINGVPSFVAKEDNKTEERFANIITDSKSREISNAQPSYLKTNANTYTKAFATPRTATTNYQNWIEKERVLEMKENTLSQIGSLFVPVGFEIGGNVQGGIILTETLSSHPFFRSEGIEGAIHFINGVDFTVGANYAVYGYKSETIAQDYPSVNPKNPNDIFEDVLVEETVVQVPIGLRYNYGFHNDVFVPYIEVGGIAKKTIQKSQKFNYSSPSRPEQSYAIRPKPQNVKEGFAMNTVALSGGVTWNPDLPNAPILDNFIVQAEVFTNADFSGETQWMAGVGVSASYMF